MQHGLYKTRLSLASSPTAAQLPQDTGTTALKGDPQQKRRNLHDRTGQATRLSGTRPAGCNQCNRKGTHLVRTWIRKTTASPRDFRMATEERGISSDRCCQGFTPRKSCTAGRHNAQPPQTIPEERRNPSHWSHTLALRVPENFQITTLSHFKACETDSLPGYHHTQVAAITRQKTSEETGNWPSATRRPTASWWLRGGLRHQGLCVPYARVRLCPPPESRHAAQQAGHSLRTLSPSYTSPRHAGHRAHGLLKGLPVR